MAAMPPERPSVNVKLRLTRQDHDALMQLATDLGVSPATALGHALSVDLFIRGLLSEGGTILYRSADGTSGEVEF
jgi:hypothetical protein